MMGFLFQCMLVLTFRRQLRKQEVAVAEEPLEVSQVRCCQEVNRMHQSGFNEHDPIFGFRDHLVHGSMARGEGTSSDTVDWSGQPSLVWSNLWVLGYPHRLPNWGRCDWARQPDHEMFSCCILRCDCPSILRRVKSHRLSLSLVMCPGRVQPLAKFFGLGFASKQTTSTLVLQDHCSLKIGKGLV